VVLEVPVTVAVKGCVRAVGTEAAVGLMFSNTATAATTVTVAEADLVGSATVVAFTLIVKDEGTLAGEIYNPLGKILPHAVPLQPAPVTLQITAVFEAPVTLAENG
jgi:hypothetical protein